MLLVDAQYSASQSSLVLTSVKGSGVLAILASGWLGDRIGPRKTLLLSLFCAALGLGVLPLPLGLGVLLCAGILAQFGISSVNTTLRLVLTHTVARAHHKEALGWMRSVNNLGQIFSFTLASLSASFGAALLIWFDALTSLLAMGVGARILPTPSDAPLAQAPRSGDRPRSRVRTWAPFLSWALVLMGWNFMYEFFMAGVAGRLKVIAPEQGLRIFSLVMVLNTILCALFSVAATRFLTRTTPSLIGAAVLTSTGLILGSLAIESRGLLFLAALLLTLGEIAYGVFGQYLLIRYLPVSRRENLIYSGAILIASLGKVIAAALVFPLFVQGGPADLLLTRWITVGIALFSIGVILALPAVED